MSVSVKHCSRHTLSVRRREPSACRAHGKNSRSHWSSSHRCPHAQYPRPRRARDAFRAPLLPLPPPIHCSARPASEHVVHTHMSPARPQHVRPATPFIQGLRHELTLADSALSLLTTGRLQGHALRFTICAHELLSLRVPTAQGPTRTPHRQCSDSPSRINIKITPAASSRI